MIIENPIRKKRKKEKKGNSKKRVKKGEIGNSEVDRRSVTYVGTCIRFLQYICAIMVYV